MADQAVQDASISQEDLRNLLKSKNLKVTVPRMAVLSVLAAANSPLSHAEVQRKMPDSDVDQSTVFRNLNFLFESGLISRAELGDRTWRFELVRDDRTEEHPHFVCTACGSVKCLDDSFIELLYNGQEIKGVGTIREILVRGRCVACEKAEAR